jgi:hypothetical protein
LKTQLVHRLHHYQAEIAQERFFEFPNYGWLSIGMEIANASLLDKVLPLLKRWLYCLFAPEIKEKQCK